MRTSYNRCMADKSTILRTVSKNNNFERIYAVMNSCQESAVMLYPVKLEYFKKIMESAYSEITNF